MRGNTKYSIAKKKREKRKEKKEKRKKRREKRGRKENPPRFSFLKKCSRKYPAKISISISLKNRLDIIEYKLSVVILINFTTRIFKQYLFIVIVLENTHCKNMCFIRKMIRKV